MSEILVVTALALVILGFGALVYGMKRQLEAVKHAVAVQEHAMLAQADHLKAQGEALTHVEEVHSLMKAVLDILDAPAMVKRWEDYQTLVAHERDQLARMAQQDVHDVSTTMGGLVELVSSLLLYSPASQRREAIDATNIPSSLKQRLHRLAAAAPDRSTLTVTLPHMADRPSVTTSALSPAQPSRLPAMPPPSPAAEVPEGTSP
jgi:hypothetical protein